jgi:hypothetical protein
VTPIARLLTSGVWWEDGDALGRPENVGERAGGEVHPYRILGELLVLELTASPPRFSPRRKRLRAVMRARLAEAFPTDVGRLHDAEDGPAAAHGNRDS